MYLYVCIFDKIVKSAKNINLQIFCHVIYHQGALYEPPVSYLAM